MGIDPNYSGFAAFTGIVGLKPVERQIWEYERPALPLVFLNPCLLKVLVLQSVSKILPCDEIKDEEWSQITITAA